MNKSFLIVKNSVWALTKEIQKDSTALKNAILLALERVPVTSLGCLVYTNITGTSVYGNRLSIVERASTVVATPLSAAIHVGFFKKCGLSLYEHLCAQGYDHNTCMDILQCLDSNAWSTMVLATLATTLLYSLSKTSDIKSLLRNNSGRIQ